MKLSTFVSALSWASFVAMLWLLVLGTLKFSIGLLVVLVVFAFFGMLYTDLPAGNEKQNPPAKG